MLDELPNVYHGYIGEISVCVTKKKHLVIINLIPDFSVDVDELALVKLNELCDHLLEILTHFYTESK
jgi:hypothetical protein